MLIVAVIAVSACTAVAADGLPKNEPDVQVAVDGPETSAAVAGVPVTGMDTPRDRSGEERAAIPPPANRPTSTPIPEPPETAVPPHRGTIVAQAVSANVVAHTLPWATSDPVAEFAHPTDRGGPLVFQAIGEPEGNWIQVLLPVRPNGTIGWVAIDDVVLTRNPYRIEVDLEDYQMVVRRGDKIQMSVPVAVGQGGTPTPIGDFYLIELLQPPAPNGPYGTYAYGLSGYSDVLDNFNGGDGVIGIHGTDRPELLGGPVSHGCIRVHNDTIEAMAQILPLGTPVSIVGGT